uniref:PARP catalytic domain-containing protein n=1 Tax=Ditylenchus dipsaci TaxID=166011 RepID=A0A915DM04_9BILA
MEVMASKRPEGSQEPEVTQVPKFIQVPEVTLAPIVAEIGNVSGVMEVVQNAPLIVPLTKNEMIRKVVEFTNCSEMVAKAALINSNNNSDEAINFVLDRILPRKPPNQIQANNFRAISSLEEAGQSTKLRETCNYKIAIEKELTKSFLHDYMLDRIVQDYVAEKEDAQELTNYFDSRWNRYFREDFNGRVDSKALADPPLKGGKPYTKPYGCMRYAISVVGKYPPNDHWLGGNGVPNEEEWPVAYHGTKEVNVLDILVNGFKLEKGKRFTYGKGIYCTPDPRIALEFASDYKFQNEKFKLILQNRVDPKRLQIVMKSYPSENEEYWIVPDGNAIRPYAICVYDQKADIRHFALSAQLQQYHLHNHPQAPMFLRSQASGPRNSTDVHLMQYQSSSDKSKSKGSNNLNRYRRLLASQEESEKQKSSKLPRSKPPTTKYSKQESNEYNGMAGPSTSSILNATSSTNTEQPLSNRRKATTRRLYHINKFSSVLQKNGEFSNTVPRDQPSSVNTTGPADSEVLELKNRESDGSEADNKSRSQQQ